MLPFHEDPLLYHKKNNKRLPMMAKIAKVFLGLTATSAQAESIFYFQKFLYRKKKLAGANNILQPCVY